MSGLDVMPEIESNVIPEVLDVLSPGERPLLLTVFSFFPGRDLLTMFRRHFEKRRHLAPRITTKPLNKVQASDILEKLDRLVEVDPGFVEAVVEGFKALYVDPPDRSADPQLRWAWNRLMGVEEESGSTSAELVEELRDAQNELSRLRAELEQEKKRTSQQEKRIQMLQESQLQHADQREKKLLASHEKEVRQLRVDIELWKMKHTTSQQRLSQLEKEGQLQKKQHSELVDALRQALKDKQQEVIEREKELREARQQSLLHQGTAAELNQLKGQNLQLLKENRQLQTEKHQLEVDVMNLQQQPLMEAPLDADALSKTLILNYQAFGTSALERLSSLIQGYDACLNKRFRDPRLLKASNSSQFVSKKPKHLLLLGVEEMLYDAVSLRLHHLLSSRLMKQHEVLSRLMPQAEKLVEVQE